MLMLLFAYEKVILIYIHKIICKKGIKYKQTISRLKTYSRVVIKSIKVFNFRKYI